MIEAAGIRTSPQPVVNDVATGRAALADLGPAPELTGITACDLDNVRDAVARADIRYPVAFDPDFATWRAYQNHYWPAFYLIDKRGQVRLTKAGEGRYDEPEAAIQALLAEPR